MSHLKQRWVRVSQTRRCPVCDHANWCLISPDGGAVLCPRTPSAAGWKGKDGNGGYLHKLDGRPQPSPPAPVAYPAKLARPALAEIARRAESAVSPHRLAVLARNLGISVDSLRRVRVGWADGVGMATSRGSDVRVCAWAFPMVDVAGAICGIRFRTEEGRKFSFTGGSEGLFLPTGLTGACPMLICEGPTSLGALLDLGYDAVGRPNCMGGADLLVQLLRRSRRCDVVVVGDRDGRKERPDGTGWYPGQEGAARLAQRLLPECRSVKVLIPPSHKDVRDWKNAGATRAAVDCVIRATNYVRKASA